MIKNMDAVIVFNDRRYLVKNCHNVFYLRDNIKTKHMVETLLAGGKEITEAEIATKEIYKFDNNQWYFYEHDFSCWEAANEYKPCPELDPKIQAEYMKNLK